MTNNIKIALDTVYVYGEGGHRYSAHMSEKNFNKIVCDGGYKDDIKDMLCNDSSSNTARYVKFDSDELFNFICLHGTTEKFSYRNSYYDDSIIIRVRKN